MREVDIIYLYEHAARELDVACAVASVLKREFDVAVEIIQWPVEFPRVLNKIRPRKLVVLPYCYSERDYSPLLAYWKDVHYFNLAWEQIFYEGNAKTKTPRGKFTLHTVIHQAWSEAYADFLRGVGVSNDHIFLNGQPAYTLYDLPYRNYFDTRDELASRYRIDPGHRWIFFPENYNWAFYPMEKLKLFVREDQSLEDIYTMKEFCSLSFSEVLHWFYRLLQTTEKLDLVIRPRPYTLLEDFRGAVERVLGQIPERMHIIQGESVREWILASDVILSSYSTSLIEAAVAGKNVFILEPLPIPVRLQAEWQTKMPHIRQYSELENVCNTDQGTVPDNRLAAWARSTMMSQGDSIRNVVRYINDLLTIPVSRQSNISSSRWSLFPPVIWSVYRNLRQKIRYNYTDGVEPMHVKDLVSPADRNLME